MSKVAVAIRRADLDADHAVARVSDLPDMDWSIWLRKAGASASRFILVGRRKERFVGYDVDVNTGGFVVQIDTGIRSLRSVLLSDAILFGRQSSDRVWVLAVTYHDLPRWFRGSRDWEARAVQTAAAARVSLVSGVEDLDIHISRPGGERTVRGEQSSPSEGRNRDARKSLMCRGHLRYRKSA